jgi:hypothetical protein
MANDSWSRYGCSGILVAVHGAAKEHGRVLMRDRVELDTHHPHAWFSTCHLQDRSGRIDRQFVWREQMVLRTHEIASPAQCFVEPA